MDAAEALFEQSWMQALKLAVLPVPVLIYVGLLGWLLLGRPAPVRARAPVAELGSESPAVVALLMNRWRVTGSAMAATVLDLAARRYLEMDQPDGDPTRTVLRLRGAESARSRRVGPAELTGHEREVLEWIRRCGKPGRAVPLAAFAPDGTKEAGDLQRRFRRAVLADARALNLSTRRPNEAIETVFFATAMGFAGNVAIALVFVLPDWRWWIAGPVTFFGLLLPLIALSNAPMVRNDWSTATGRRAAAHWAGVKAYLDGPEVFDELPPAAVTVWERYLAYAAAVGSARLATRTLGVLWTGAVPQPSRPGGSDPARLGRHRPAIRGGPSALFDADRPVDGVRLGPITIDERDVVTPDGRHARRHVRWTVLADVRLATRVDSTPLALFLGLMCMFPINLAMLAFAIHRRRTGTITVTVRVPDGAYTTQIPFDSDEEYNAIWATLAEVGALTGQHRLPPPRSTDTR